MPDSTHSPLDDLRQVFVTEAEEHLGVLEEGLVALEADPGDAEGLRAVFRSIHTLKGSASLLGLDAVESVAHRAEDVLATLRDGKAPVTEGVVSLLLRAVDGLRRMVETVADGGAPHPDEAADMARALGDWRPDSSTEPEAPAPRPVVPSSPPRHSQDRVLRVEVAKLDRLLEIATELVLTRRVFAARLGASGAGEARPLREAFEDDWSLYDELRDAVMEMRMVPVGPALRRFARHVRDAAASTGKKARLVVEGEGVEVDTSIVEQLVDPVTHLVRNAVDHGIETPEARIEVGKEPTGTVTLRVRRDPASLVVEVTDDGSGLSRGKIAERAREAGVADPDELGDTALWELVFRPGFSTAGRVTDLSGRGVGLDVVRRNVEALRGSVEIDSREGAGTTVTLRMPLSLSLVDGLEVEVADVTFIVPLENVDTCMDAPEGTEPDDGVVDTERGPLPYARLRRLFAAEGEPPRREQMIVVRHGSRTAGLLVDRFLGEAETTVRPLGAGLTDLSRLGGSTVLRDGRIGLVLDVPGLLRDLTAGSTSSHNDLNQRA